MVTQTTEGFGDDVWRWRGLGKIAARIWHLLGDPDVSIGELPARLGVRSRTVGRHLARMERLGLVRRNEAQWVQVHGAAVRENAANILGNREGRTSASVVPERAARFPRVSRGP